MTPIEIGCICFVCFLVGMFCGGYIYAAGIGAELDAGLARCGNKLYKVTRLRE